MKRRRITRKERRELQEKVTELQWYIDEHLDLSAAQQRRTDSLAQKALRLIGERATVEGVRAAIEALIEWAKQLE